METSAVDTGFTFGQPLWLWGLLLIPALGALFAWAQSKRKSLLALVVAPRLRDQLAAGVSPLLRGLRAALILLALALALVAIAKPRMGTIQREIKTNGRDVLLAIDTSRSMLATDVAPTRLARAKLISEDLIRLLQGDRIGIVAFAGSSFLQAPLTLDYNAVRDTLDDLDTNTIPKGGTNIADAIQTATTAFGKAEGMQRALVIMTDGEELDADGVAAAKAAAAQGIRIFTIGIGTSAGSPISVQAEDGSRDYIRDDQGKMVQSKLDSSRLTEIATATGGFYLPFGPNVAKQIFDKGIQPMTTHDTGMMSARQPIEQYQWPLGVAILCLVLWVLIGEGRGRKRSSNGRAVRVAGISMAALAFAMGAGSAADAGLDQYQKGDYKGALKSFEESATTTPEKEKARFDAGAAAYKSGDFAKAVDHFTNALLSDDQALRARAAYNLGNALVRRGEQAQSPEGKEKDWKDAITHYDDTLKLHPDDADAKANRDIVKKLLEDLKKQQDQKQDQQKQDQQKQDQQKQDQQKQDQQKQDQQKQDQQKQNQQKQDQQKQDQQKQDQQKQDQQKQDQQKQDQQKQDQQKQDQQKQDQQKQDQQKQDQQKQDQQKQDQQKQDQQKQDQQKQDQQKQDQQKQDQQKQDQQKQDQQKQDQQKQDQQKQDQQKNGDSSQQQPDSSKDQSQQGKPQPTPQPSPGEKKQGDLKAQPDQQKNDDEQAPAQPVQEKDGEMSDAQARALLRSMQGEEQRVRLLERQQNQDVIKDW